MNQMLAMANALPELARLDKEDCMRRTQESNIKLPLLKNGQIDTSLLTGDILDIIFSQIKTNTSIDVIRKIEVEVKQIIDNIIDNL